MSWTPAALAEAVQRIAGEWPREVAILSLGGKNNVVARADLPAGPALVKAYFRHPGDLRDRLGAEQGVLELLWRSGARCAPEPLGADAALGVGLQRFVAGRRPREGEVDRAGVRALADLLGTLWDLRDRAAHLPLASEATFSGPELAALVERRLDRLEAELEDDELGRAARAFVVRDLRPALLGARTRAEADRPPLDPADRTISPSDVGFHNALVDAQGRWTFVDFEYAGWDDPAKALADACLQPDAPVPAELRAEFQAEVAARVASRDLLPRHARLRPLWAIKWCAILLNEFLPVARARRAAAGQLEDVRGRQLARARVALEEAAG